MRRSLTRRLVQLRPSALPDGSGGVSHGWAEGAGLWGEVRLRSGGARGGEWGPTERVRVRITIRALPDGHPARPKPGERLRDGARLYDVDAVQPEDARGLYLTVFATSAGEVTA